MAAKKEQLSPDELSYHNFMLMEQERVRNATSIWMQHLAMKYGLINGDGVSPNGTIERMEGK